MILSIHPLHYISEVSVLYKTLAVNDSFFGKSERRDDAPGEPFLLINSNYSSAILEHG
jgi:hypothetical protein